MPSIKIGNHAFLYGESIITTFVVDHGAMLAPRHHWNRLVSGGKFLWGELEQPDLREQICAFMTQLEQGRFRVRITLFKDENLKQVNFLAAEAIAADSFEQLSTPHFLSVKTTLFQQELANRQWNEIKLGSYARTNSLKRKLGEFVKVDDKNHMLEMSTSNLILVRDGKYFTPSNERQSFLQGISLRVFERFVNESGSKLKPANILIDDLKESDMLIAVNCVNPVRFIDRVDDQKLNYNDALLVNFLNDYRVFYQTVLEKSDDSNNWTCHS